MRQAISQNSCFWISSQENSDFKGSAFEFLSVLDPPYIAQSTGKIYIFPWYPSFNRKFIEIGHKRDFAKKVPEKRQF